LTVAKLFEGWGEHRTLIEWAGLAGLPLERLRARVSQGMPIELALNWPDGRKYRASAKPGEPEHWAWDLLRYQDDPWCQHVVARHPRGMTRPRIAELMGMGLGPVSEHLQRARSKLRQSRLCLELAE
jgi:hypothetical protein